MQRDSGAPPAYVSSSFPPDLKAATIVDWIAITEPPKVARIFAAASAFLACGVALVLSAAEPDGVAHQHPWLSVCGVLTIMVSAIWTFVHLTLPAHRDGYVAIRIDSLALRGEGDGEELTIPWEDLDDVHAHDGALHVVPIEGDALTLPGPFDGLGADELARRIRHARRLAVWGRLTATSLDAFRNG